jgi:hypothetical protein
VNVQNVICSSPLSSNRGMFRPFWIGVLCVLTLAFSALALLFYNFHYPPDLRPILSGRLCAVEFQPQVDRKMIQINDPQLLIQIQKWLLSARRYNQIDARTAESRLDLFFSDGRTEHLLMSATGGAQVSGRPNSPDPLLQSFSADELKFQPDFCTIEWRGFLFIGLSQPFTRYLTSTGQFWPK